MSVSSLVKHMTMLSAKRPQGTSWQNTLDKRERGSTKGEAGKYKHLADYFSKDPFQTDKES